MNFILISNHPVISKHNFSKRSSPSCNVVTNRKLPIGIPIAKHFFQHDVFLGQHIDVASVCVLFFSFGITTKMLKWLQLRALSSDKKGHFLNKPAETKIRSPSSLQPVYPACILFTLTAVEGGGGFAGFC